MVSCSGLLRLQEAFLWQKNYKAGSNGRLYLFNKRTSDKDTRHVQKFHQGGKDYGKELALVETTNRGEMKTPMN